MNLEERVRSELQLAADALPERRHEFAPTLRAGRRSLLWRRAAMVAAAVAVSALGVMSVASLAPVGESVPPGSTRVPGSDASEIDATITSFHSLVEEDRVQESWAMLTPGARQRVGTTEDWSAVLRDLRAEIGWIDEADIDLSVTKLPRPVPSTYLATYTAPVRDGSALLEVFAVEEHGSEFLVDIDLRQDISLLPEVPRFMACSPPCEPEDLWPEVSAGDVFSVVLEPTDASSRPKIENVWFAVGAGDWVGRATLTDEDGDVVRAQVKFDPEDVSEGENVFTVSIETVDGMLETYGYRVIYTEG